MRHHEPPPARGRFRIVAFVGFACVVAGLLALHLRSSDTGKALADVPPEVLGRWVTADARYAGRALRVEPDTVVFELGPGRAPRRGVILSRRTWVEGTVRVVRIEYDAGDGLERMDMMIVGPDKMRLRNPREVLWTKKH